MDVKRAGSEGLPRPVADQNIEQNLRELLRRDRALERKIEAVTSEAITVHAGDGIEITGPVTERTVSVNRYTGSVADRGHLDFAGGEVYVKLGMAANLAAKGSDLQAHLNNTSNPHNVTAAQVGAEPAFGVLGAERGGTGHDSYVSQDLLVASGTSALARLPVGSPGQVLGIVSGPTIQWRNNVAEDTNLLNGEPGSFYLALSNATGKLTVAKINGDTVEVNKFLRSTGGAPPADPTWAELIATDISNSTTVGRNLLTLANPSAVRFLRVNEANTVSALTATDFRSAIFAANINHNHQINDLAGTPLEINKGGTGQITQNGIFTGTLGASGAGQALVQTASETGNRFIRVVDNATVDYLTANDFRSAIGASSATDNYDHWELVIGGGSRNIVGHDRFQLIAGDNVTLTLLASDPGTPDLHQVQIDAAGGGEPDPHTHPYTDITFASLTTGHVWRATSTTVASFGTLTNAAFANNTIAHARLVNIAANQLLGRGSGSGAVLAIGWGELALAAGQITSGTFDNARISVANVTQHEGMLAIDAVQLTGTLADARVAQSNVTQHQAALSIGLGQITGHSTAGNVLRSTGSAWASAQLAIADTTGTVTVGRGGTNLTTWSAAGRIVYSTSATALATLAMTSGAIILGAGTGAPTMLGGTNGQYLKRVSGAWAAATLSGADVDSLPATKITEGTFGTGSYTMQRSGDAPLTLNRTEGTSGIHTVLRAQRNGSTRWIIGYTDDSTFTLFDGTGTQRFRVDLSNGSIVAGTLPAASLTGQVGVATGGTGRSTLTSNALLSGNGTSAVNLIGGTNGQFLKRVSGAWVSTAVTKTDVGLSNVENTALSTWAGSTSITTLGTIATGTVPAARVSAGTFPGAYTFAGAVTLSSTLSVTGTSTLSSTLAVTGADDTEATIASFAVQSGAARGGIAVRAVFGAGAADKFGIIQSSGINSGLRFQYNDGAEKIGVVLNKSGDLGIGTADIEAWGNEVAIQFGTRAAFYSTPNLHFGYNWYFDTAWKYRVTDVASRATFGTSGIQFHVAPSGTIDTAITWTTALTIDNGGQVGIGGTPGRALHVHGTAAVPSPFFAVERAAATTSAMLLGAESNMTSIYSRASNASTTARDFRIVMGGTEALRLDTGHRLLLNTTATGATEAGGLHATGRSVFTGRVDMNDPWKTSARWLKANIRDLDGSTDRLLSLRPRSFSHREIGWSMGFVGDEIAAVDCRYGDKTGWRTETVVADLVAGWQGHHEWLESHERRIETAEERIERLEAELAEARAELRRAA